MHACMLVTTALLEACACTSSTARPGSYYGIALALPHLVGFNDSAYWSTVCCIAHAIQPTGNCLRYSIRHTNCVTLNHTHTYERDYVSLRSTPIELDLRMCVTTRDWHSLSCSVDKSHCALHMFRVVCYYQLRTITSISLGSLRSHTRAYANYY